MEFQQSDKNRNQTAKGQDVDEANTADLKNIGRDRGAKRLNDTVDRWRHSKAEKGQVI